MSLYAACGRLYIEPLEQGHEILAPQLLARHEPLGWAEAQDRAEYRGHGAMARERAIVEDEILQLAPLHGHEHRAMRRIDGRDDARAPRAQREASLRAGADADAAAQADRLVDLGLAPKRDMRIVGRDQGHRLDGTGVHAGAAARAASRFELGHEIGRVDRVERGEAALGDEGFAAAAAAIADEIDAPLDVLAELDEAALVGRLQEPHALGDGGGARVAVFRERFRGGVEGHADVHGRVAGAAEVHHLVTAVAHAYADTRGGLDDFARPLVVEDQERVVGREHRFLDVGAT